MRKNPRKPENIEKTVDIPIPNAYNNNVKMNRNSSGQGAADDAYSRPTVQSVNCFWQPNRCDSGTDSIVWMREESVQKYIAYPVLQIYEMIPDRNESFYRVFCIRKTDTAQYTGNTSPEFPKDLKGELL